MIRIQITGPSHSGKGHAIAAVAKELERLGAVVTVQGGDTHNKPKLDKSPEELREKLAGVSVVITELQTGI